ncbi:MAG: ribosome small subunit-dependent GTPase A [Opitutaceae bacterium]|jgi:ribosome biogenesis GTPase|nr:ribosome small subunit-dependent GTPase A [Opitutaceae bacterium]
MSAPTQNLELVPYGWDAGWEAAFAPHAAAGLRPARVVVELRRHYYAVVTADGELLAECTGKFHHDAKRQPDLYPAVGDWVAVAPIAGAEGRAQLHALLPRRSRFSRQSAGGEQSQQLIAANIDVVFLVSGLDRNYNPKRIQRFLVAARDSGAAPVIVLNKADLHDDPESVREEIERLVPGVPVLVTSSQTRRGIKLLGGHAAPGRTLAFVGSSGVGKSSLINRLARDAELPTGEVREKDAKGRHTTTRRELVLAPSGALIIDTPGMRELQLWDADEALEEAYADIVEVATRCRFTSCRHEDEPACAVRAAIEAGTLPAERLASYRKLKAEQAAKAPSLKKPGAVASKPGWRKKADERAAKPFRHQHHRED